MIEKGNDFFALTKINPPIIGRPIINGGKYVNYDTKLYILDNDVKVAFPSDILAKFNEAGLRPWKFRYFSWIANNICPWHVDTTAKLADTLQSTINWVVKGQGVMQWNKKISFEGTIRKGFDQGSVQGSIGDQIDMETSGHQCLVNTSIPHRVLVGHEGRSTISLLWEDNLTFNQVKEKLKSVDLLD